MAGDHDPAVGRARCLCLDPIGRGAVVRLNRIYTRTGDDGTTSLGDMSRTTKHDLRLIAYADVDEANCVIGVVLSTSEVSDDVRALLLRIQNVLRRGRAGAAVAHVGHGAAIATAAGGCEGECGDARQTSGEHAPGKDCRSHG